MRMTRTTRVNPTQTADGSVPVAGAKGAAVAGDDTFVTGTQGNVDRPVAAGSLPKLQIDAANPPTTPATAAAFAGQVGRWQNEGALLVTASTVEGALAGSDRPFGSRSRSIAAAMQKDGALGAVGPLGKLGPVGDKPWNPTYWSGGGDDWSSASQDMSSNGGPGSNRGPLGDDGAIAKHDRFDPDFQAGGALAAYGLTGPLGPLGPLGYLGRLGGHGHTRNPDGDFVNADGNVVRSVTVERGDAARPYELFEMYSKAKASSMTDNDTSWMVRGQASEGGDTFPFKSGSDQFVTLAVVPEDMNDSFELELLDKQGRVVATSNSDTSINWIQVQADAGRELQVRVKQTADAKSGHTMTSAFVEAALTPMMLAYGMFDPASAKQEPNTYRLVVVGSTNEVADTNVTGPHQRRVQWND